MACELSQASLVPSLINYGADGKMSRDSGRNKTRNTGSISKRIYNKIVILVEYSFLH